MLSKHFVSCWSLVVELKALEKDENQPEIAKLAKYALEEYKFPVMMYVWLPNGTLVYKDNANEFLDKNNGEDDSERPSFLETGFEDPSGIAYEKFLKFGLRKSQEFIQGGT